MGLIGISSPQPIYADLKEHGIDYVINGFVVVAHTEEETVKLFYSEDDSSEQLKKLLLDNGLSESTALGIINAAGMHITAQNNGDDPSTLASKLPGVSGLKALHPVTKKEGTLHTIIISLNDSYGWTREAIADWIESTFDTKDIAFDLPKEVKNEKVQLSDIAKVVTVKPLLPSST